MMRWTMTLAMTLALTACSAAPEAAHPLGATEAQKTTVAALADREPSLAEVAAPEGWQASIEPTPGTVDDDGTAVLGTVVLRQIQNPRVSSVAPTASTRL